MTRLKRVLLYSSLGLISVLAAIAVSGILVFQSQWFRNMIRERTIMEVEKATGGRVAFDNFDFDWERMRATVSGLVLHGKEKPGQAPLFRAATMTVGLKIVSILEKTVDLASLTLDRPEIHVYVAPDGSTNLPTPTIASTEGRNPIEQLLALKVGEFTLKDGMAEYDSQRIPIDIRGEHLNLKFVYEATGPTYRGDISSRQMHVSSARTAPLAFDLDASFALDKSRIQLIRARLAMRESSIELSGNIADWTAPRGEFEVKAALALAELARPFGLPIAPQGVVSFDGKAGVSFTTADYDLAGKVSGRGLAYRDEKVRVDGIDFGGRLEVKPARIALPVFTVTALGATFAGRAELNDRTRFQVAGNVKGAEIGTVVHLVIPRPFPWAGVASGSMKLSGAIERGGVRRLHLESDLSIAPGIGEIPIDGALQAAYDQESGEVRLGDSHIATASSSLEVSGTLGATLRVRANSTDLRDALPAVTFAGGRVPGSLPVTLHGGEARFEGTVTGPLARPDINGQASVTRFQFQGHDFDRAAVDFNLSDSGLNLRSVNVQQGSAQMDGKGQVGLQDWQLVDTSSVQASVNLRDARIESLLSEGGYKLPLSGIASATVKVEGSYAAPRAEAQVEADQISVEGQRFDRARASIRYTAKSVEIGSAELNLGQTRIQLSGSYHPRLDSKGDPDWETGQVAFHIQTKALDITQISAIANARPGLGALLDVNATGNGRLAGTQFEPVLLNGQAALHGVSLDKRAIGDLQLAVTTRDGKLDVEANALIHKLNIAGSGSWRLGGDYQGQAAIQLPRISFETLREFAQSAGQQPPLPFLGFLEGSATVAGPLTKPEEFRGELTLSTIEVQPKPQQQIRFAARAQDLIVKNAEPVLIQFDRNKARVVSARFTAKDTNLELAGTAGFDSKAPWDLRVRGGVNLAILQILNPALLGQGNATVSATIRGSLSDPQVNGSMQLRSASLYLSDLTSGVDNANGVVLFDQSRATIESLTAEFGGGKISLAGFVGFGGAGAPLLYRLQGKADTARIRTPEGVSVSVSADLSLTGTSENSLVSGVVTVVRASFNPRTDIGALLAEATKPTPASTTPSEYLRGMQFDVRLESSPSLELQTSLARNIQVEMDLHLRGSPTRPVLLGDVSVNEGEIELFGNKYTISRGDIRFLNQVKIEPIFDVDLETKARGIDVSISFSGPLSRLNVTYRSDPPLQASEILALLAVGRDPNSTLGLANSQVAAQSSFLQSGANTLLGQAISQQLSSRLQRFFGVSRVKIDPLLTGVYNTPQARLTVEQQVSKDITMTYVTNLTGTQSQIVQIEWDLSTHWSATAVRDENGVFGIDFQYKKRLR